MLVDVGGDLTVASVQDTGSSGGSSVNWNVSSTGGGIGGGDSGSSTAWVDEQTSLTGGNSAKISVDGHTQLDGAVIGSDLNSDQLIRDFARVDLIGGLDFETGTFGSTDIKDNNESHDNSLNVSVGGSTTVTGELSNADKEQVNKATVLGGEVEITDAAGQAELADGTSPDAVDGVNYDPSKVNTDINNAQVITKDETNSATVYIDQAAIEEIREDFPTLGKAIDNLGEIFEGETLQKAQTVVARLLEIDPDSFAVCTDTQTSWLHFNWLLASPAYAAEADGCLIRFANGDILEMDASDVAKLKAQVQANAEAEMKSLLQQRADLMASGASAEEIAKIDGLIIQNASYFELCGEQPGSLASSGILNGYPHANVVIDVASGYRAGGDQLASQFPANEQELMNLRATNPDLYFAMYYVFYRDGGDSRNPNNLNTHVIDAMYALNGASITTNPEARLALLQTSAQLTANLMLSETSTGGNHGRDIQKLMQIAGKNLTEEEKFIFIATAVSITGPYNQSIEQSVARARLLTGALLAGAGGIAIAADAYPAMVACMQTTLCMNQMAITIGEIAAGDALGGAALAPAIAMVGGKLVMSKGDEIFGFIDDVTKEVITWPAGTKVSLNNVVDIARLPNGKVVWLETGIATGKGQGGLSHILYGHEQQFADMGIPANQIPEMIFETLTKNNIIGYSSGTPVYLVNNKPVLIAVSENGYVTTAYPITKFDRIQ